MRYFIYLSYLGRSYHGWQKQPNAVTVQEVIEKSLSTIMGEKIEIVGAGRTDTGVNAKTMVAHFDTIMDFEPEDLTRRLNSLLPQDIAIKHIRTVVDTAHARFSAISRSYKYYLYFEKTPFLTHLAYRHFRPLDFERMNEAAKIMLEEKDFTSFSKLHTDNLTNICQVSEANWAKDGEVWVFSISANRFLRDMVRATVGTLLWVGEGKKTVNEFRQIINAKDRNKAGQSVPAQGLYLTDVVYPKEIFIDIL